jgi:hypothetical protein
MGKTGGVSLGKVLGRTFGARVINRFDEPTNSALGLRTLQHARDVVRASLGQTPEPRLVVGHIPFGVHAELAESRYITVVREPRDRVISSYYYLRGIKTLPISPVLERLTLEEYVAARFGLDPHDYQTRILSGDPQLDGELTGEEIANYKEVDSPDLQKALANIDTHFLFVGLTDRLEESLLLLRRLYAWRFEDLLLERQNVGGDRPDMSSVAPSTLALIDANNRFDSQLYNECRRRFARLVKEQGWRFRLEARVFRHASRLVDGGVRRKRIALWLCRLLDRLDRPLRKKLA